MKKPRKLSWRWQTGQTPWLWHAMFDGTPLCGCAHSKLYKSQITMEQFDKIYEEAPNAHR